MQVRVALFVLYALVLVCFPQSALAQDNYFNCGKKSYALSDVASISEESARDILQRVKLVYERPDSDDADMVDPAWSGLGTYYRGEGYDEILYYLLKIRVNRGASWLQAPQKRWNNEEYHFGHLVTVNKNWKYAFNARGKYVVEVYCITPKGSFTSLMPRLNHDKWGQGRPDTELNFFLPELRDEALEVIFRNFNSDFDRFVKETDPSGYIRKERFDPLLLDLCKGIYSFHEDCGLETAKLAAGKAIEIALKYAKNESYRDKIKIFAQESGIEYTEPPAPSEEKKRVF